MPPILKRIFLLLTALALAAPAALPARASQGSAPDITFLVLDHNSYLARLAADSLASEGAATDNRAQSCRIAVVTASDLEENPNQQGPNRVKQLLDQSPVVLVDVMGRELEAFVTTHINPASKPVYALRGSLDDAGLKKKGFIFDDEVSAYYRHISVDNIRNMLCLILHRHKDSAITYEAVRPRPQLGLFHPQAMKDRGKDSGIFTGFDDYMAWARSRPGFDPDRPWIGFLFFSSFLTPGQQVPVEAGIERLEAEGFNVIPCFGREKEAVTTFLLDHEGQPRVDMLLAFSFKFYSSLTPELARVLEQLDVPIFSAVSAYQDTIDQWRKSPVGISTTAVAWSMAVPEISGLIEPTVLSGKERQIHSPSGKPVYVSQVVEETMDRLIPRLNRWQILRDKPNPDKKIALMFYNHHQGKQNIGASYLNVFRSIEQIVAGLRKNGYHTGQPLTGEGIKELILASARNIGSWAPGELDKIMGSGRVIQVPLDTYKAWFADLPEDFQKQVIRQWGPPESSKIMSQDRAFIIPAVVSGNLILLPEPARGWGDDPMKLYHDTTLYPHHQYLAVYLWLSRAFRADAMIHLGTHATYEWTPGKQAGLSPSCAPEVLITDIPNLYPYIVDDVGEGIQAKRRGRGVILSHLTPVLKKADIQEEYSRMAELVNEIQQAQALGSAAAEEKKAEVMALARATGILEDLKESPGRATEDTIHLLGHYLEEVKETLIPYGMHTFGKSPAPEVLEELTAAVIAANPKVSPNLVHDSILSSGTDELRNLIRGLEGRYVPTGQGNDPVRNPESLPTGRNFYGFNPGKLPSPAAWILGQKAAQQIIKNHLNKNGSFPQKVALVLWATETLRNEGVNESTILSLIGVKPRWSRTGRVLGVDVIPGKKLGRPRIDVMVNASGLYRDLYPDKMLFLDRAVQLAARQNDVENLIARHNAEIKTRLIQSGMAEDRADEMSRFRIFSEPPGAYGNGISEMASGSSKWEDPDLVVETYENRMGYAFGEGRTQKDPVWGRDAKAAFKAQLSQVDVAVHSRSSNVYGLLDNDDMFQYLGGLSMAVRKESGASPETLITDQRSPGQVTVEDMGKTLGREMRARYLNPKWIQGMKAEDYAGAKAMADFVEYLWGWDMTTPEKVDEAKWDQTYEVYVKDKYGLELKEFFAEASPWAFQSITARMLETHRKGYWKADDKQLETLSAEYAKSIVAKGIACCDHTCNNPMLNQMVAAIISIPGVVSPDIAMQFKIAVEQMAQKSLETQVENRKQLLQELAAPGSDTAQPNPADASQMKKQDTPFTPSGQAQDLKEVEGYKMEKMEKKQEVTQMTSSGMEWTAILAVLGILLLFAFGARNRKL